VAFDAVARIRHRKPLHPRGVVLPARVDRTGSRTSFRAAWLDETGPLDGVVRLSRSAGLPDGWPDVWGLALRVDLPGGSPGVADLLLSTAWGGAVARHVLALRRSPRAPFTSVLPYRTPSGTSVLLAALGPQVDLPSDRAGLADALARTPWRLVLAVAAGEGPWEEYGELTVGGRALATGDGTRADDAAFDVSFDPVLNPLPGLRLPDPLAVIRARAYAGARRGRAAEPSTLRVSPADLSGARTGDPS
jgi:hypothetical protein